MTEDKPLFQLNAAKAVVIPIPTAEGVKRAKVRYPTDAEWCARTRQMRAIRRPVRGDLHEMEVPRAAADLALLSKILIEPAQFEEAEAASIIDRLDEVSVADAQRTSDGFCVTLEVGSGIETVHYLKRPSLSDVRSFDKASSHMFSGNKRMEIASALEPAGDLYDRLHISHEGYAADVPINHKYIVACEVSEQVRQLVKELTIEIPPE